jgi:tetratricopeptide (TPR) repeat protein
VPALRAETVAMLTRAGERAERAGAPTAAASAYTTAADLLQQEPSPEEELSAAALHERAGKAIGIGGEQLAAISHYQAAAEMYARHGRIRDAARANTQLGDALRSRGRHEEARAILGDALAVLEPEADADTVDALKTLATLEAFTGNHAEADRLSAASLDQAQALSVPESTLADLFTARGLAHVVASRPVQAAASYREAVRQAEAGGDSGASMRALLNLGDVLLITDPEAACETSRKAMTHGRRIGSRFALSIAESNLLQGLLLTGAWDEAELVYENGATADGLHEEPALAYSAVLLRAFRGDRDGVEGVLPVLQRWAGTEDPQELASESTAVAAAAMSEANPVRALSDAQRAIAHAESLSLTSDAIRWAWPIAADAALALHDLAEVTRLLDWLDEHPPGHIPPVLRAERLRIRARLLAAQNDRAAGSAFDAAVKAFRDFGSPYHLAVGLLDQAEYLAATGDPDTAHKLAMEAETITQRLGARPLLARAGLFAQPGPTRQLRQPTPSPT